MRVAIIPARGGSKRIPRKNIKPFFGKPMIAYTIEVARESGVFERIIVSTDDEEIAAVARAFGAETPFSRPLELADDHAGTTEVVAHAVRWLQTQGAALQAVCCLYATAPFLQARDIRAGMQALTSGGWDFVFSATTFPSPIFRAFALNEDGGLRMFHPEFFLTRSQDLPEAWHDAGQFYWGTPAAWLASRPVFGARSTIVKLPRWRVQDIDTEEDWVRAEKLYQLLEDEARSLQGR